MDPIMYQKPEGMKTTTLRGAALLLFLLLLTAGAQAQFTVTGEVHDAVGEPLIGVSILVKGTTRGTVTDIDGRFTLEAPGNEATLVFSYTGFRAEEVLVTPADNDLSIRLEQDIANLEEVVVTGLATTVKRSNLANSVATIPAKEISGITVPTTTDAALYGKFKGVNISQASGAPGGGLSFRLRGLTSINGSSQPLIILDGVFIDNSSIAGGLNLVSQAAGGGSQSNQDNPSNRWADIDPNDIEKIDILKGPSAAAIYGSRSSGGVVIITTKRGSAGKTRVRLTQSLGWTQMLNPLGVRQWDEDKVLNSSFANDIDNFRQARDNGQLNNYEDALYGNKGLLSNTRLTVSGGNERTKFFVGGTFKDEAGIVNNTGYGKVSARANVDHRINDWLEVSVSTNYINSSADRGFFNNDNSGTTMGIAFTSTPSWAQLFPDENGIYPNNPYAPSNFLQTAALITNNERVNRFIGGGTIEASLLSDTRNLLQLTIRGGADYYNLLTTAIFPNSLQFQSDGAGLNGVSIQGNTNNLNTNLFAFLEYTHYTPGGSSFKTHLGVTREDFDRNTILAEAANLIGSQTNVDQSGTRNVTQERLIQKDRGFFVQQTANFQDKVILTAGLRADKSSNNSDPNQLYFYPKASAAVNVHEIFTIDPTVVGLFKLRVAYGQSGNFAEFGSKFTEFNSTILNGVPGIGISNTRGNQEVGPERQEEIEFGFDLGLFTNRLLLDATYYNRSVTDLLLEAQVPTSSGFTRQVTNAAALVNRGLEIGLSGDILRGVDFNWAARIGWWRNQTEVTELLVPSFTTGGFADFLGQYRIKEGRSPTEIIGVGPAEDADEDGLVIYGDAQPDFQMSFYNTITFKRFDLSFLFHWKQGGENINLSTLLFDLNETTHDFDDTGLDPDGNLANGPYRLSQLGVNTGPYVEDATYVRLREIGLFYTFPREMLSGIADLRLGFSGTNLLNFFEYNSYDPEVSNFGNNGLSSSVEVTPFPSAKRFNFHLSLEF